jgi:hypothetical protein
MTTATVQSQEQPRVRERASAAPTPKPRARPRTAPPTARRPNRGASGGTAPTQRFGSGPAAEAAPAAAAPPEAAGRRPAEEQAVIARRAILPAALASAFGMDRFIESVGFRRYLDDVLKDAGNPTDPVEIMLLEQLTVSHLRAAQLQGHAGQAVGLEAIAVYNAAAARLTAEFRKTVLTLKEYRR